MTLIPLVDPDLSQEETVCRILQSTNDFNNIANDVFRRLEQRLQSITIALDRNFERYNVVKSKIATLEKTETAVVLKAPSKFPEIEYVPARRILPFIPGVIACSYNENDRPFVPKNPACGLVDLKNELEQRKQFYATSQLFPAYQEEKKKRQIPSELVSVADLFYEDTDIPAYDGVGGAFLTHSSKSKSMTSRMDPKQAKDHLDRTAIGGRSRVDEDDPFIFCPLSSEVPDLDLPDFLPDLPGVALDVVLTDLPPILGNFLPDFDQKHVASDMPLASTSKASTPVISTVPPTNNVATPISLIAPPPPPPPPPPIITPISIPPPPVAPPPMAPPPPPPPILKTPMISPTEGEGRSDLMAAIRAAGGVGKIKLKSVKTTQPKGRQTEEKQSLKETTALPSGGGDLMSSLAKALEARRKAMTGTEKTTKPGKISGVMSRISDMIPHEPNEKTADTHTDSGGEDWS